MPIHVSVITPAPAADGSRGRDAAPARDEASTGVQASTPQVLPKSPRDTNCPVNDWAS